MTLLVNVVEMKLLRIKNLIKRTTGHEFGMYSVRFLLNIDRERVL